MSSRCWPLTPERTKTKPTLKLLGGCRTQFSGMAWTPELIVQQWKVPAVSTCCLCRWSADGGATVPHHLLPRLLLFVLRPVAPVLDQGREKKCWAQHRPPRHPKPLSYGLFKQTCRNSAATLWWSGDWAVPCWHSLNRTGSLRKGRHTPPPGGTCFQPHQEPGGWRL